MPINPIVMRLPGASWPNTVAGHDGRERKRRAGEGGTLEELTAGEGMLFIASTPAEMADGSRPVKPSTYNRGICRNAAASQKLSIIGDTTIGHGSGSASSPLCQNGTPRPPFLPALPHIPPPSPLLIPTLLREGIRWG